MEYLLKASSKYIFLYYTFMYVFVQLSFKLGGNL